MRALRIERPHEIHLVEVERPSVGPDEVLIAVRKAGICGSDLELLNGTRPAPYARYPVIPGHEWAGEVVEAGRESDLALGENVVAEGFRNCGVCERCREGHTNLCTAAYAETGFTHQGALAEYLSVPARLVHRIPDTADLSAAALLEPAACVAEGLIQVDPQPGLEVAIVGAGTLGLLAVVLLRLVRPARLVLVGTHPNRLALGGELGATETFDVGGGNSVGRLDSQFDVVFEATNRPGGAQTALGLARRGGTVVMEGINGSSLPSVISDSFSLKQLHVHGVFGASANAWRWVVGQFTKAELRFGRLVTHSFRLEEFAEAFATCEDRSVGAVKVQLHP